MVAEEIRIVKYKIRLMAEWAEGSENWKIVYELFEKYGVFDNTKRVYDYSDGNGYYRVKFTLKNGATIIIEELSEEDGKITDFYITINSDSGLRYFDIPEQKKELEEELKGLLKDRKFL
jgi:uncharacterized protein YeeX (DUF496 family)